MNMMTLDRALDVVMQLDIEEQGLLLDIMYRRHIEAWRQETARYAETMSRAFDAGTLQPITASALIGKLHNLLDEDDV